MKYNFNSLLEQSRQLTSTIDAPLPLNRNVEQIGQTSKKLVQQTTSRISGDAAKNKAHYLLAAKGFDAEKLSRNLNSINLKTTFEPIEPLTETDIDGYLKHEHDLIILTAIEEGKKQTISRFEDGFRSNLEQDWDKIKREMFRGPRPQGPYKGDAVTGTPATPGGRHQGTPYSPMASRSPMPGMRSAMDNKMVKYAQVVAAASDHLRRGQPFGLLSSFSEAASHFDDKDNRKAEIMDCWELLAYMLREHDVVQGEFQGSLLPKLAYHDKYLNNTKDLKRLLIRGAKNFLEQQYSRLIKKQIGAQPRIAMLGPKGSFKDIVRAFINVKFNKVRDNWPQELEIVDGYPIWAQIFYCLRCGQLQTALELSQGADSRLGNIRIYLAEYADSPDGRLKDTRWNEVIHEYKLYASRGNCDPFKLAVLNIIGKCEVNKSFSNVFTTTQDFIWLKLCMVRENDEALAPAFKEFDYPLKKLQDLLTSYGPSHFNKSGRNSLLYFQVLLMSQQFESAIQYLSSVDLYQVEALHFSLSLYYYGLLRQPATIQKQLDQDPPIFDFVRMLRQYVGIFSMTDPIDALHYYCMIHDEAPTPNGPSLRDYCIKDLVLETREFELLFGDGVKPGHIEQLLGRQKTMHLMEYAALDSEANGRYEDSVCLFELSQNYDKVLDILNNQIGRVLSTKNPERDRLITLAMRMYQKHEQLKIFSQVRDRNVLIAFEQLLSLVSFFDLYHAGRYFEALRHMENLDVLPLDQRDLEKKSESFKLLDNSIKRNFAEILVATMDILYKIYGNLKSSSVGMPPYRDGGKEQKIQEIRNRARVLVMFSGMIQFRTPGDTTARLIRMEVFMSN